VARQEFVSRKEPALNKFTDFQWCRDVWEKQGQGVRSVITLSEIKLEHLHCSGVGVICSITCPFLHF